MTPKFWRHRRKLRDSPTPETTFTSEQTRLALYGLGITGEAGEAADIIKKHLFHGQPLETERLIKEVGDTLWYCDGILDVLGVTMEECLQINDDKLEARYPIAQGGWDGAAIHYNHKDG